jgi:hypothetical protein
VGQNRYLDGNSAFDYVTDRNVPRPVSLIGVGHPDGPCTRTSLANAKTNCVFRFISDFTGAVPANNPVLTYYFEK